MLLESQSGAAAVYEGIPIAVVGMVIVFSVLIFLALVFMGFQKYMMAQAKNSMEKQGRNVANITDKDLSVPADVNAAISAALHLYLNESGEQESGVITIKKVERRYSPWSSKIYSLNNLNFPR